MKALIPVLLLSALAPGPVLEQAPETPAPAVKAQAGPSGPARQREQAPPPWRLAQLESKLEQALELERKA